MTGWPGRLILIAQDVCAVVFAVLLLIMFVL